jgi:hypothetical protein
VVILHDGLGAVTVLLLNSLEMVLVVVDFIVSVEESHFSDILCLEMQVASPEFKGRSTHFLPE